MSITTQNFHLDSLSSKPTCISFLILIFAPKSRSAFQPLQQDTTSDCSFYQGSNPPEIKPLSLPSLASITANLSPRTSTTEQSQFGPHRTCPLGISSRRRFSPLCNSADYGDSLSPLDSEYSTSIFGEGRPSVSGISMIMASTHRPRSRSFLSGPSLASNVAESDAHADDSASDSGSSDKKNEDNDSLALSKKRSRTLTTPSQQRRLMQILDQTRFPSTDVREKLARELGMTPRRVQIWFQNRRQGMKKALEQKPAHEISATPTTNFHRSRGLSFGAYPTPADLYSHGGPHHSNQAKYIPPTPDYQTSSVTFLKPSVETLDSQDDLYAPRSVSRGVPRNLHLQLSSDHSAFSSLDTFGGSVSDLMWSDPSTANSLYSNSSVVDKESNFSPFAEANQHVYPDSNSQTLSFSASRHRSQTNPDLIGMMNDYIGLSFPGQSPFEPIHQYHHSPGEERGVNGANLLASKNDSWKNSYGQPASNWHENLGPLKSKTNRRVSDQTLYHLDANLENIGFHYPLRNQETIMEDNIGFSTLDLDREGSYALNSIGVNEEHSASTSADVLLAQHHFRQRSQSLNSLV